MENFLKHTANLCSVDSLIDKFSRELNSDSAETRRLTIEFPNKSSADSSIDDINRKIFDLENVIKSLQEEIDEMYANADKEKKLQEQFEVENINKECTTSQAYPLVLSEVDRPLAEQSNRFKSERDFLVNFGASKSMDSLSSITKAFATLWNDEEDIMKRVRDSDDFNFNS